MDDIDIMAEINSVELCGQACVGNVNCSRFSYSVSAATCDLKWPLSNSIPVPSDKYSCGFVINRLVKSIPTPGPLPIAAGMFQSDDQIWRTV